MAMYAGLVVMHVADWWWLIGPLVLVTALTGLWLWLQNPIEEESSRAEVDD